MGLRPIAKDRLGSLRVKGLREVRQDQGAVDPVNSSKAKGDRAELEVQGLLRDLLGVQARRKLGAGRQDDMGDIDGLVDTVISVTNRKDVATAVRHKPLEVERQRENAHATFAATFVRLRGGQYRVVLTPEQFCTLWREAVDW